MSIYNDWNFSENPFQSTALPAEKKGKELLVGRDQEIAQIQRRLYNPPAAVTVEGLNGIGKTSLVNVAVYESYLDFFDKRNDTLYIPCGKTFQLNPEKDLEEFIDEVYREIAQTLIKRSEEFKILGFSVPEKSHTIDKWLNSPQLKSFQLTLGPIGGGASTQFNATGGYERSGFRKTIDSWLLEMFPFPHYGAIVCIIDNLELLETSDNAKRYLERLRDILLASPGFRWIMCGASGIVKSIASTPRLEGYLHRPIEIAGIDAQYSVELFEKRITYFSRGNHYIPIIGSSFSFLFEVLNYNLRNTLHYCDQYCLWVVDHEEHPETDAEKDSLFVKWLQIEAQGIFDSVYAQLRPRALKLFEEIIKNGGVFSPSDYSSLGFNNISALRRQVFELEKTGLLVSSIDETDNRRKTIQVTPKGLFMSYAQRNKAP